MKNGLQFASLTPDTWKDFEALFGARGACGGCWCMWWRLKRPEYLRQKGAGNRAAMKKITRSGDSAGLIAYLKGAPVAWCSVAPRESFPVLDRSRVLKRLDEKRGQRSEVRGQKSEVRGQKLGGNQRIGSQTRGHNTSRT